MRAYRVDLRSNPQNRAKKSMPDVIFTTTLFLWKTLVLPSGPFTNRVDLQRYRVGHVKQKLCIKIYLHWSQSHPSSRILLPSHTPVLKKILQTWGFKIDDARPKTSSRTASLMTWSDESFVTKSVTLLLCIVTFSKSHSSQAVYMYLSHLSSFALCDGMWLSVEKS